MSRRTTLLVVFAVALVATTLLLAIVPDSVRPNESTDYSGFYRPVAERVLDGHGLSLPDGRFADRYPPGYPLLLAGAFAFGDVVGLGHATTASILVVLCMAASCLLLFLIAERLFASQRIAIAAAVLWVLYPINLMMASQPYSEVPFTVLVYGGLLLLVRSLHRQVLPLGVAAAAGLLFGLAALMRPAALLVWAPVALVVLALRSRPLAERLRFAGVLAVVFVLTLLPWQVVLMAKTDSAAPLSTGGPDAITAGLMLNHRPDEQGTAWVPARVDRLFAEVAANESEIDDSTGDVVRFVGERVGDDPVMGVQLVALKAARSWFGTDSLNNEMLVLLLQVAYLAVAAVGVFVALRSRLAAPAGVALVLATIAYFWAVTIVVASIVRYLSPVAGLLTPFVAAALLSLPGLRRPAAS